MIPHDAAPEHEFEAERGLPERLPADERLLWQGAPDWRILARDAMHLRAVSIYFGVLLLWRGVTVLSGGGSAVDALVAVAWLAPLALVCIALLASMAWLVSRTSVYTVTDRRIVMRIGVVLSITFNLPYSKVEAVALKGHADGSGDLSMLLAGSDRIAYAHLWPHARPWQLRRTQPTMRALGDVRHVARLLSTALADSSGIASTALPPRPAPDTPVTLPLPAAGHAGAGASRQPLAA
ncbi:MAG: photosynthetic complex putative assembly protein PuhB [Caldimonas sp.]